MGRLIRLGNLMGSLLVLPHRRLGAARLVWGVLAGVSLLAGFVFAGARSEAYWEVRHWLEVWRNGVDVYSIPRLSVDYPPNAMVILAPLAWLPAAYAAQIFALVNIAVCGLSTWLLVSITARLAGVSLSRGERVAYVLMLLAWTPIRVCIWCGQTTPIVLLFLCAALRIVDEWPMVAGLCLAIGALKPHAAIGFLVVFMFERRFAALVAAAVALSSLVMAYCLSIGRSVFDVLGEYYATLTSIYGGPGFLRGEVDMRPFFTDLLGAYGFSEPMFLLSAVILGFLLLWFSWRARSAPRGLMLIFSTALVWSLAVFPFRRYGLLLIAPIILYFLWADNVSRRTMQLLGLVVLSLLIDVPFVIRHLILNFGPPAMMTVEPYLHYFNRVPVVLFLLIGLVRMARLGSEVRAAVPAIAPAV